MTNDQDHPPSTGQSLEGHVFTLTDPQERLRVIELAFDYRGDVTIELGSGEMIEGYLFDRDGASSSPTIKMFLKGQSEARTLDIQQIISLTFSGEDTAFGKSWDDWVNKKEKVSQKVHASGE
ncbi:MAG: hypothetical protein MRJ96_08015 [Nitrospirales bacterium]|nr:hypothetical protein [Nitrospira sp.]MDR4501377.1 hypothetical protein [Nitrospirales bacterium]